MQGGTPLYALQELGGWESPDMVRRYAHLTVEHLAPYADRLCTLRDVEEVSDAVAGRALRHKSVTGPQMTRG